MPPVEQALITPLGVKFQAVVSNLPDEFDVDEEPEELVVVDARHSIAPGSLRVEDKQSKQPSAPETSIKALAP